MGKVTWLAVRIRGHFREAGESRAWKDMKRPLSCLQSSFPWPVESVGSHTCTQSLLRMGSWWAESGSLAITKTVLSGKHKEQGSGGNEEREDASEDVTIDKGQPELDPSRGGLWTTVTQPCLPGGKGTLHPNWLVTGWRPASGWRWRLHHSHRVTPW